MDDMKPGNQAGALTQQEQEAVDFFRDYEDIVCNTLRYPKDLKFEEEWSNFLAFLHNLDSALCKSSLDEPCLLFRGVRGDYAERLLFLLDILSGQEQRARGNFTNHLLQDPSYVTFSVKLSPALDGPATPGSPRILFVYECRPGDNALLMGGKNKEVLFPRNIRWLTTGYLHCESGITCISLEQFA